MALLEYEYLVLDKYFTDKDVRITTLNDVKLYALADIAVIVKDNNIMSNTAIIEIHSLKYNGKGKPMRFINISDLHKYVYHVMKAKPIVKYVENYNNKLRKDAISIDAYNVTTDLGSEWVKLRTRKDNTYMYHAMVCILDMIDTFKPGAKDDPEKGLDDSFLTLYTTEFLIRTAKGFQYVYNRGKLYEKLVPYFTDDENRQKYKNYPLSDYPLLPLAQFGLKPIKYQMSIVCEEFYSSLEYPDGYLGRIYKNFYLDS
jgi:hypothetical protein